jgi:hypothetical protein
MGSVAMRDANGRPRYGLTTGARCGATAGPAWRWVRRVGAWKAVEVTSREVDAALLVSGIDLRTDIDAGRHGEAYRVGRLRRRRGELGMRRSRDESGAYAVRARRLLRATGACAKGEEGACEGGQRGACGGRKDACDR